MKQIRITIILFILTALLIGCGGSEPDAVADAPAAQPTNQPAAEPTDVPPTELPPTATATLPAPPTQIVEPATPTPLPVVEEPTEAPTPTPEAISLFTDEDFEGRSRLTGLEVPEEDRAEVLNRRPVMCKMSNHPPEWTRPQSGLNSADIMIEKPIEGVFTRFVGVFQSQAPEAIGPIRSARLIDMDLVEMYDGALCFSGAAIGVSRLINRSPIRHAAIRSHFEGYYRTGEDKPYEHTFYADPLGFWKALEEIEQNRAQNIDVQTPFTSEPPPNGGDEDYLAIDYRDWSKVEWRYNAEENLYYRWADGVQAVDGVNDEPVSVRTVAVVSAWSGIKYEICVSDTECHETAFNVVIEGSGYGLVLRDGKVYEGSWKREQPHAMFTFYDAGGNLVPFQLGKSWIQIVPHYFEDPILLGNRDGEIEDPFEYVPENRE